MWQLKIKFMIEKIKEYNREYVKSGEYRHHQAEKYPRKKIAVVTCMDTRLLTLLPTAMGIKNGDVIMIKNASGLVVDPYSDSMRSILISVYELGVEKVMIIAHTNCGVEGLEASHMYSAMKKRGIEEGVIEEVKKSGVDLDNWFTGFTHIEDAVSESVRTVADHPLLPSGIEVAGFVMDTVTGELTEIK